jgi:hypothetical protein
MMRGWKQRCAFGERYVAALRVTPRQASDAQAFVWQSLEKQSEDGSVKPALPIRSAGVVFAGQLWKEVRRLEAQRQGGLLPSSQTIVVPEF